MIAWNKGQTVTWSRGHVMDRFRPGQAPRRPATAFNPDRPRNRPTDRQTTRINQPDRPNHREPRRLSSPLPPLLPPIRPRPPRVFFSIFPSSVLILRVPARSFAYPSPSRPREFSEIFGTGLHGPPRSNNVNYVILNLDTRRLSGKTAGRAPAGD